MQSESNNASTGCIIALLGTWFTDAANGSFARKITLGNSQSGNPHFGTGLAAKEIGRIQLGHSGSPQAIRDVDHMRCCHTWMTSKEIS